MRALILGAIALSCAFAPASAYAAETGIIPDITWGISDQDQDREAGAMRDVGAAWARLNISWSDWVEPAEGRYGKQALSHFDRGIDLAIAAGYKVMVTVEESPSWAHDGDNNNSPPRDNGKLANFMSFLANRYEGKVEAYQVWNEPNLSWAWPSGPNAAQYAQMLRTVAPAIRAADPSAKVVFAGISRNDYHYVEDAYKAMPDIGNYFDVMATHPYVYYGASPEVTSYDQAGRMPLGTFAGYREIYREMADHGDAKPIWLTEFGWSTTTNTDVPHNIGVSPATQAAYLTRAYQCLEQDPYVQVAFWYNLRNEYWANDENSWVTQLGLMTTDFTPKPAYYAMKNVVPGGGGCVYTPPTPQQPEPTPTPTPTDPGPVVSSSTFRRSSMLAVRRVRVRHGELSIAGRLARGISGKVHGVARYRGGERHFATRVSSTGKLNLKKRLFGAKDARTARVTLRYGGSKLFSKQRVTLKAAQRSARLQISAPDVLASSTESEVSGSVVRKARGSVTLQLTYRTAGGRATSKMRAKVRDGQFRHALALPADAQDPVLRAVFPGDGPRGIAGQSTALKLGS